MKKLLLLPILLFAFNATAMEKYLDEAKELYEKSEVSKAEKPPQDSCADEREGRLDSKEKELSCKKLLKTPYWQMVLKMSQVDKDDILAELIAADELTDNDEDWERRRYQIAAAICAGANSNIKSKNFPKSRPLSTSLYHKDHSLTELLLKHDADPHLDMDSFMRKHPAICDARTVVEAKLLFEHGASPHVKCNSISKSSLLHENIISSSTETPELIDLCLQKGTDPNARSNVLGWTALHQLADSVIKPKDIRRMGKALIDYGVEVDAKDVWLGETAEDILLRRKMNECLEFEDRVSEFKLRKCESIDALLEVIRQKQKKKSKD